jgi:hypothetical protein
MNYTFKVDIINVVPAKLQNVMYPDGKDSMEQVGPEDFVVTEKNINKTDLELKNISLIRLIEEVYRGNPFLQRDYGILLLSVGKESTYKFFTKDFISSDSLQRFYNHLFLSRIVREQLFLSAVPAEKQKVSNPEGNFDKNDLYGWCTPGYRDSYNFDIKIFPYPFQDVVTAYDGSSYTYQLNGLSAPFLSQLYPTKPKKNHLDVLDNIKNRYLQIFFPHFFPLGDSPFPEFNISSDLFQKKYLKYKQKYLQLKNNFYRK